MVITELDAQSNPGLVTQEIQQGIDQLASLGGGRLVIPTGHFMTGAIELKSNVELHLESGAVLTFSDNQADYPVVSSRWEGVERQVYQPCIYAHDAVNISITGFGKLDGNGQNWWHVFREDREKLVHPRPQFVGFDNCDRVVLRDFQIENSPSWTIHPVNCQNVTIDNLSIKNPADSPNTDGIDPESCRNVRIANCQIDVGDDCIAIKAGTEENPERIACENITITNCTLLHGHGGVVLGSEMSGGIKNVTISNCVFKQTDRGIRLKSRRGRGGLVESLTVNNIIMDGTICPFVLNLYYFCGPKGKEDYVSDKTPYPVDRRTPEFKQIHFSNIIAKNVSSAAGYVYGLPEKVVSDVQFSNIQVEMVGQNAVADKPAMMAGIEPMTNRGFTLINADGVTFDNFQIKNFQGPAFNIQAAKHVQLINGTTSLQNEAE
nr:glycoside hydrolase family 28 protein [Lapidilactobacillus mulanensis]